MTRWPNALSGGTGPGQRHEDRPHEGRPVDDVAGEDLEQVRPSATASAVGLPPTPKSADG